MKTIGKKERNRRVPFIRQAIAKGAGRFFGGEKFLYVLSDYVLLAFQELVCFSIWRSGNPPELVFTTFKDPDPHIVDRLDLLTGNHLAGFGRNRVVIPGRSPSGNRYFVTLHDLTRDGFHVAAPDKMALLKEIFSDVRDAGPGAFSSDLIRTFDEIREPSVDSSCDVNPENLSNDEVNRLLSPMRGVLDAAFEEMHEHKSLSVKLNDGHFPNLFAVVRTIRSVERRRSSDERGFQGFPYTASLVLSNTQKDLLPNLCGDSHLWEGHRQGCEWTSRGHKCIDYLEMPLGQNARAVFDSVVFSGCVDFGLIGEIEEPGRWRDIAGDSQQDRLRQDIERCVYGVLTGGKATSIFYVPIHVGGAPWMSFFTLSHTDDDEAWDDNYCFYRDIIAKLSDRIRLGAQRVYIDAIVAELKQAFEGPSEKMFEVINHRWKVLSQIFPFRQHSLQVCPHESEGSMSFPNGVNTVLVSSKNLYFNSQVDYGHVDDVVLQKRVNDELVVIQDQAEKIEMGKYERLQSQAHTILNCLPKGNIRQIIKIDNLQSAKEYAIKSLHSTEIVEMAFLIAIRRHLPNLGNSILGVLRWLHERMSNYLVKPTLVVAPNCPDVTFRVAAGKYSDVLGSVFTVFWNLWDNSLKRASGIPEGGWSTVSASHEPGSDYLIICFKNSGEISPDWVAFLGGVGPSPNKDPRHMKGLEAVMSLVQFLGWKIIPQALPPDFETRICLMIPLKTMEGNR